MCQKIAKILQKPQKLNKNKFPKNLIKIVKLKTLLRITQNKEINENKTFLEENSKKKSTFNFIPTLYTSQESTEI